MTAFSPPLPREIVRPARARTIVATALLTVCFVAIVNGAAILVLARNSPNIGYRLVTAKWHLLAKTGPVDVVVLGDSTCNQALDPDLIERETGLTAVNLCSIGAMTAIDDAWMLAEYIERNGPPSRVIVMHAYDVWARKFHSRFLARIPRTYAVLSQRDPALTFSLRQRARGLFEPLLPLYFESSSLARLIRSPTRKYDLPLSPKGFMSMEQAPENNVSKDTKSHLRRIRSSRRPKSPLSDHNKRALRALTDLAAAHHFKVDVVASPIYEGLANAPAFRTYYDDLRRSLEPFANDHLRIHPTPVTFPADVMENADHLLGAAPAAFTKNVIERVDL